MQTFTWTTKGKTYTLDLDTIERALDCAAEDHDEGFNDLVCDVLAALGDTLGEAVDDALASL